MIPILPLVLSVLAAGRSPLPAVPQGGLQDARVRVVAPALGPEVRAAVGRDADRLARVLERRLGRPFPRTVELHLVPRLGDLPAPIREAFVGMTVGLAELHEARIWLVRAKLGSAPPDDLRTTLLHELAHVWLGERELALAGGARRLPAWFHEGFAQYLAGEGYYGGSDEVLATNLAFGRLVAWADLDRAMPRDARDRRLAYAQSLSYFGYCVGRLGLRAVLATAEAWLASPGRTLDGILYDREDHTFTELEAAWLQWESAGGGLFALVRNHLFEVLMFSSIPLMVLVLRRRNRREAEAGARLDREDDEEAVLEATWRELDGTEPRA
ncbi:MAG: hypothetical protein R3F30_10150 [Planctomycetota bacterium]